MSLLNHVNGTSFEEVDPGYISESAMEQLCNMIAVETLNPEEMDQYVAESVEGTPVTEAQKNIVKLNKQAKLQRAYKTAVLQCAAEDKKKEYKKLRTLWKLEAKLFRKLENQYKNKAMVRAREAVKNQAKKKSPIAKATAQRAGDIKGGANKLLNSKPIANLGGKK